MTIGEPLIIIIVIIINGHLGGGGYLGLSFEMKQLIFQ